MYIFEILERIYFLGKTVYSKINFSLELLTMVWSDITLVSIANRVETERHSDKNTPSLRLTKITSVSIKRKNLKIEDNTIK